MSAAHIRAQLQALEDKKKARLDAEKGVDEDAINLQWKGKRICSVCCHVESPGHSLVCQTDDCPQCPGYLDRGVSCILPTAALKARKHADFKTDLKDQAAHNALMQRLTKAEAKEKAQEAKQVLFAEKQHNEHITNYRLGRNSIALNYFNHLQILSGAVCMASFSLLKFCVRAAPPQALALELSRK
jgi:hypothetical protein